MNEIIMNEIIIRILWAVTAGVIVGVGIYFFLKLPTGTQKQKIKEWLLWAVTETEKNLGSGTGQIKLRQVYDLFIDKFRFVSTLVPFDTFSKWVDEALDKMRVLLQSNPALQEFVSSNEDVKKEG